MEELRDPISAEFLGYATSLEVSARTYLSIVLILQAILFIGTLLVQLFFLHFLILITVLIGLLADALGYAAIRSNTWNTRSICIKLFEYLQVIGSFVIIAASIWTFVGIKNYHKRCYGQYETDYHLLCPPLAILGAAAACEPFLLVLFMLGAIYSRRLYNLWPKLDSIRHAEQQPEWNPIEDSISIKE